ncbi:TRAP transporter small permease [Desertibaculum subflavum]|uniref:TRAP transporter small permease n=1 Tax=Desertibaculum subflavum TaxID=2268458 RepID=UPI0013C4511B
MALIDKLLERASGVLLTFAGIVIMVMMLHITADVLAKVLLNHPIIGTLEFVAVIYMVATIFPALPHVQWGRGNIIVELFTQKLPAQQRLGLDALGALLTFVYLGLIAWMGAETAWHRTTIGETQDATFFEVPVWPSRWVLVVGAAFAALIALHQFIDDTRFLATGKRTRASLGNHPI